MLVTIEILDLFHTCFIPVSYTVLEEFSNSSRIFVEYFSNHCRHIAVVVPSRSRTSAVPRSPPFIQLCHSEGVAFSLFVSRGCLSGLTTEESQPKHEDHNIKIQQSSINSR
ncbi:MAG: hypothetical protein K8F36_09885 [Melioribacteraceae bacterium]|nr:hypothetical protein [Melioribacteraceae bacterium]